MRRRPWPRLEGRLAQSDMTSPQRRSDAAPEAGEPAPIVQFHFLGRVDFDDSLALQERLEHDALARADRQIVVLLCEHSGVISVGRSGSRGHIRMTDEQLRGRRLRVRWVRRGGGCILHAPGQLAVYLIAPLEQCGWSVGGYLRRLHQGLVGALEALDIPARPIGSHFSVWGRTGLLAVVGAAVRREIASQGLFVNVNPAMNPFAFIDSVPPDTLPDGERATMSCLLAERRRAVRMTSVRAALVEQLAAALGCPRYHLHTGHPQLARRGGPRTDDGSD